MGTIRMGMECEIQALTARQIEALCANPDLTGAVLMAHDDKTAETLFDEPLCAGLYLGKAWDILRFLMLRCADETESDDPTDWSCELLLGELIGESTGYAEPYLRSIAETRGFAAFLQPLTLDQLMSNFDCEEMLEEDVYGVLEQDVGDEDREREIREYASDYFPLLREYVLKAAASNCGLLLTIY